ncbi:methyltransferase family protein [Cnuibacter sp. UC19_7]|uniref:isoprenylcysteine carboxylmethyltransferase family protein n=1 Tax=Cnuibacter sp. UC19_7 TaxID=3350166 RepID=UPI00366FAC7F
MRATALGIAVPAELGRLYFAAQAVAGAAWWVAVFTVPFVRDATLGSIDPVLMALADVPLFVVGSALAAAGVRAAAPIATGWTLLVAVSLAVYATVTTQAGWGVVAMIAASAGSAVALCSVRWGRIPTAWVVKGPFGFRPAAPGRGRAAPVLATLGQIVVFWGFFLVVLPLVISALEQRWGLAVPLPSPIAAAVSIVGAVVLALASTLGLWSGVTMSALGDGTPLPAAMTTRLVVAGPYRWVRNPMALAGITQGAAVGLLLGSWLVVLYAVAGSAVWNLVVRPHEEDDLEARFGPDFVAYRTHVRCWLPRLTPYAPVSPR